jgi:acyl-CoA reductase-like NAD-dependent aldehyde dehydrogenase
MYGGSTIVRRDPVGVVAAIVSWNMPQTLPSFELAPALAAGLLHRGEAAPETVLDAFLLAQLHGFVVDVGHEPHVWHIGCSLTATDRGTVRC